VRRLITRRLTEEIEKTPELVDELLAAALKDENGEHTRRHHSRHVERGLEGFSQVASSRSTGTSSPKTATSASSDLLRDLNLLFGSGRAADELIALVNNQEGDANARRSAFDSLMRSP